VAVTDAAQNPTRQAAQLAGLIDRKPNVIFSVPIDPASPTAAYKRVAASGIKLVFMDNVASEMTPGRDYVTEKNAAWATVELVKAIGGRGEIAGCSPLNAFVFTSEPVGKHAVGVSKSSELSRVSAPTPQYQPGMPDGPRCNYLLASRATPVRGARCGIHLNVCKRFQSCRGMGCWSFLRGVGRRPFGWAV
jgi:hypothetical protein